MTGKPSGRRTYRCPPEHKHGLTSTCYDFHKCGCDDCLTYVREQRARRRRMRAYGRTLRDNLVDAAPARMHVESLRAAGIGWKQVARLAGVPLQRVEHLIYGCSVKTPDRYRPPVPAKRIDRDVAEKILAVSFDPAVLADSTLVSLVGVRRRLQALVWLGWSAREISARCSMSRDSIGLILRGRVDSVHASTHRELSALFVELWDVAPPSDTPARKRAATLSRKLARRNGWVSALAWDDIDNDVRPARVEVASRRDFVDDVVVELACSGRRPRRLSHAEIRLVIRELHSRQFGDPLIAERAGISDREVVRIRKHELGLPAVAYGVSVHRRVA